MYIIFPNVTNVTKQNPALHYLYKKNTVMFGLLKNLFGANDPVAIQPNAFIVDVRSPGEFASGSVKGAVNIPLDNLRSQLARFKSKEQVVVFCRSGMRSAQAKSILESSGIENVVNAGGLGQAQALLSK